MSQRGSGRGALAVCGLAALLASVCCLGPLLLMLGVSGAWIGNLTALEPYRFWFIGLALIALFFAWRHVFRPVADCEPDTACTATRIRTIYKTLFWVVAALVLLALVFPYVAPVFY